MTTDHMTLEQPSQFRRRQFVESRRRKSAFRLLVKPFLSAILVVGLPVAVGYWLWVTPRFDLKEIEVSGTELVMPEQVLATLKPIESSQLLWLSLEDVETRVETNRWIEGTTIRKELPNKLLVEIHEREPVALLRHEGDLYYVDLGGYLIEPYNPTGPVDLPLLSASPGVAVNVGLALEVAERFTRAVPGWGNGLSEIEILGEEDFRLHTAGLNFPVLVTAGTFESQLLSLQSVLSEIEERYPVPVTVDLRFGRQIVIQPAVQPRSEKG